MPSIVELRRRAADQVAEAQRLTAEIEGDPARNFTQEEEDRIESLSTQAQTDLDEAERLEQRGQRLAGLQQRSAAPSQTSAVPLMPHTDSRNTRNGRHGYSICKAIRSQLNGPEAVPLDGLEREAHFELCRVRNKRARGVMIPWDAPYSSRELQQDARQRGVLTTATGSGGAMIPTNVYPTLIDALRPRLVLARLGASVIDDQTAPFRIPKVATAPSASHIAEGVVPAADTLVLNEDLMTYHIAKSKVPVSREFLMGAGPASEGMVSRILVSGVSVEVERGCIVGSDANNEPKGLFDYDSGDGVNIKALGANGLALDWPAITQMVGLIDNANVPQDSLGWLFNGMTAAKLRSTPKVAGQAKFILDDDGRVCEYPYATTSLVPSNLTKGSGTGLSACAFGAWEEALIVFFGGIDVMVDPYSQMPNVSLLAITDFDFDLMKPGAFVLCNDIVTS